jgi:hypothetical protein
LILFLLPFASIDASRSITIFIYALFSFIRATSPALITFIPIAFSDTTDSFSKYIALRVCAFITRLYGLSSFSPQIACALQ